MAAQREQLVRDARGGLAGIPDLEGAFAREPGLTERIQQHLRVAQHHGEQVVEVVGRLKDHVAPFPAVAAIGATLGNVGLAAESNATGPAMTGTGVHFDFVDEHEGGG